MVTTLIINLSEGLVNCWIHPHAAFQRAWHDKHPVDQYTELIPGVGLACRLGRSGPSPPLARRELVADIFRALDSPPVNRLCRANS